VYAAGSEDAEPKKDPVESCPVVARPNLIKYRSFGEQGHDRPLYFISPKNSHLISPNLYPAAKGLMDVFSLVRYQKLFHPYRGRLKSPYRPS